jgi:beta-glucosidase
MLGVTADRLSVEWARIEPWPGLFDQWALDHYRQLLDGLRTERIEPVVTLHRFTNPLWLVRAGAWDSSSWSCSSTVRR